MDVGSMFQELLLEKPTSQLQLAAIAAFTSAKRFA